MKFLDINTFYGPKAGGIRTYHSQKIEWFKNHPEHEYVLVGPAASYALEEISPNIRYYQVRGRQVTSDSNGYRILWDIKNVLKIIKSENPDWIETGDPWLSGPMCLLLHKIGLIQQPISSFYHSDPIRTYLEPWATRGVFSGFKKGLVRAFEPLFFVLQRSYDLTLASSRVMERYLEGHQVKVQLTPFGAPKAFFQWDGEYPKIENEIRLIYSGRLDQEKGIDALIQALPEILKFPKVKLTVGGRGAYEFFFSQYQHPNFQFVGYISDPIEYRALLSKHHLFLAPGPYETFALGVLEAMALGIPVVGPNGGGTGEILSQDPSFKLFESGSVADFLRVIEYYISSDLAEFSKKHKCLAQEYGTWSDCFKRMVQIYDTDKTS